MSRNIAKLKLFTKYCEKHPEERFWQALRNWSEYNFIFGSQEKTAEMIKLGLEDTFYKE